VYASMYGNTAKMADYIAHKIADAGVKQIRVHDVSKTHISYLINDIWRFKGVVLGSCAYNTQMFPLMESLTRELVHIGVKNRYLGLFGSYSWNGGGVKNLKLFADEIGWEQVAEPAEIMGRPACDKYAACDALAAGMAGKLQH
ncbi:MAG: FprA family A-type flavoprotein, partial [Alistipes sp.]|nr:FprA family A-type flavoprotein [Alistipes sp.]